METHVAVDFGGLTSRVAAWNVPEGGAARVPENMGSYQELVDTEVHLYLELSDVDDIASGDDDPELLGDAKYAFRKPGARYVASISGLKLLLGMKWAAQVPAVLRDALACEGITVQNARPGEEDVHFVWTCAVALGDDGGRAKREVNVRRATPCVYALVSEFFATELLPRSVQGLKVNPERMHVAVTVPSQALMFVRDLMVRIVKRMWPSATVHVLSEPLAATLHVLAANAGSAEEEDQETDEASGSGSNSGGKGGRYILTVDMGNATLDVALLDISTAVLQDGSVVLERVKELMSVTSKHAVGHIHTEALRTEMARRLMAALARHVPVTTPVQGAATKKLVYNILTKDRAQAAKHRFASDYNLHVQHVTDNNRTTRFAVAGDASDDIHRLASFMSEQSRLADCFMSTKAFKEVIEAALSIDAKKAADQGMFDAANGELAKFLRTLKKDPTFRACRKAKEPMTVHLVGGGSLGVRVLETIKRELSICEDRDKVLSKFRWNTVVDGALQFLLCRDFVDHSQLRTGVGMVVVAEDRKGNVQSRIYDLVPIGTVLPYKATLTHVWVDGSRDALMADQDVYEADPSGSGGYMVQVPIVDGVYTNGEVYDPNSGNYVMQMVLARSADNQKRYMQVTVDMPTCNVLNVALSIGETVVEHKLEKQSGKWCGDAAQGDTNAVVVPEVVANADAVPEVVANADVVPEVIANADVVPEVVANADVVPEVVANATVVPEVVVNATVVPEVVANADVVLEVVANATAVPEVVANEDTEDDPEDTEDDPEVTNADVPEVANADVPEVAQAQEDVPEVDPVTHDVPKDAPVDDAMEVALPDTNVKIGNKGKGKSGSNNKHSRQQAVEGEAPAPKTRRISPRLHPDQV
jgi:hypothetical protein